MKLGDGFSWQVSVRVLLVTAVGGLTIFGIAAMYVSAGSVVGVAASIVRELRDLGSAGVVLFALLQAFVAISGVLPASLLGFAAGAFYGLPTGFALAAVSTLIGALIAFVLSRSLFRPLVERAASRRPRLRSLDGLIARDGWKLVFLLRISPVMPFSATSYLLGLSSIDLRAYLVGTLGSLPALAGYVFLGTLADASLSAWSNGASPLRWSLLGAGGIATAALTVRLSWIAVRLGVISRASDPAGGIQL
jgi:uncharacterized membrane protein YdjX (TVP38/TMEM64 family)